MVNVETGLHGPSPATLRPCTCHEYEPGVSPWTAKVSPCCHAVSRLNDVFHMWMR